jgi:hypothetical protein
MPTGESRTARFAPVPEAGWWFRHWASERVMAGVTDRRTDRSALLRRAHESVAVVEAEQVHGGSVAVIERFGAGDAMIAGCDALVTSLPGVTLLVRTADCLPLFFADPRQGVVGLAHVGWRGLIAALPARVVDALRRAYQTPADALYVAIGPSIRACCYDVGPEFAARFGPFVRRRGARHVCDLVGAARHQLQQCGVRTSRVSDTRRCTACEAPHWFSVRREGDATGRLASIIMVRP